MKLRQLKVKVKSLAAEQRIIRMEERKELSSNRYLRMRQEPCSDGTYNSLHEHRIHAVRPEARATLIAYGLLRGKSIDQIESVSSKKPYRAPDWKRVEQMVKKYGESEVINVDAAIAYQKALSDKYEMLREAA